MKGRQRPGEGATGGAPAQETPPSSGRRAGPLGALGAAGKELVIVVGTALLLSFVVKTWLLQAFYIPSASMEDTLRVNDRVVVSKLTPGPVDLRRGDVVVFEDPAEWLAQPLVHQRSPLRGAVHEALVFVGLLPDDSKNHLIKRVIGLAGDRVECCDERGRVAVNGAPLAEPYLKPGVSPSEKEFSITVPAESLWVMGDHRSDSADSRFHDPGGGGQDGSVPVENVVGRAVAIVWPFHHARWLSTPSQTFADVPTPGAG
jgi:signal peptidase I